MLRSQAESLNLGEKINDDPYRVTVADGHIVGADVYATTVKVNGVEKVVEVYVVDPDNICGYNENKEGPALLGRGFLDNFDVLFEGKEKKIALFHPG